MMTARTARNLLQPFAGLPAGAVLLVSVCILIQAVIVICFLERYKALHANARPRLRSLEVSKQLLDGNEEYDIQSVVLTSDKDIAIAKRAVRRYYIASAAVLLTCTIAILSELILMASVASMSSAREHGYADGWDIILSDLWTGTDVSLAEDELPDSLSGSIVLYYKFGCPDCEALGPELYATLSQIAPVYCVATRSKTGQMLTASYPVASVPSCVYFTSSGTPLYYTLYLDSDTGLPVINNKAISDLVHAVLTDRQITAP